MSASWLIEIADLQAKFSKVPSIGSMCRTYPEALTLENFSFFFGNRKYLLCVVPLSSGTDS